MGLKRTVPPLQGSGIGLGPVDPGLQPGLRYFAPLGLTCPHPVMRQPDPKRWDLSPLAESPAADAAVLAEQGPEGWAANLEAEDRR